MEQMLTAMTKMTGLDLGPASGSNRNALRPDSTLTSPMAAHPKYSKIWSATPEDMTLQTPNLVLPESAGFQRTPSPRFHCKQSKGITTSFNNGGNMGADEERTVESMTEREDNNGPEDVLTTPVLMMPKSGDIWSRMGKSPGGRLHGSTMDAFSPENLSAGSPSPLELGPREPPHDLPMDSDIGLRSPCDGLLAKRRQMYRMKQAGSVNSDTNSCDTPTSDNSPRDLTTGSSKSGVSCSGALVSMDCRTDEGADTSNTATTASGDLPGSTSIVATTERSRKCGTNSCLHEDGSCVEDSSEYSTMASRPAVQAQGDRGFKYPGKKLIGNNSLKDGPPPLMELSSHYTPSPGAVPSPNWSAVDRFMGNEVLKTPKALDSSYFDFLGPPPTTPRNNSQKYYSRDDSPGGAEQDRYSGRDQRLSPRLSPRFRIPEAPTDLSSGTRRSPSSEGDREPPPCPEDLSMSKAQDKVRTSQENIMSEPHSTSPRHTISQEESVLNMTSLSQMKRELQLDGEVSHHHDPLPSGGQINQLQLNAVKSELNEDYDYSCPSSLLSHQQDHQQHQQTTLPSAATFPNHLYLQGFYQRQLYPDFHQSRPSPPSSSPLPPLSRVTPSPGNYLQMPICSAANNPYGDAITAMAFANQHTRPHPSISPYPHQTVSHAPWSNPALSQHPWKMPCSQSNDEDCASMSCRSPIPSFPVNHKAVSGSGSLQVKPAVQLFKNCGESERKRGRKPGGASANDSVNGRTDVNTKKKRTKKVKVTMEGGENAGLPKRVYSCPHCQRTYDWNYNLNRHLKYECGKENAFQCAKCGRRFPHKQNCVYHLKRKHKVICETVDQYIAEGLVVFHGSSSNGHETKHTAV